MPLSTYPYSYGFPVSYFLISIAVLLGLYFLRKKTYACIGFRYLLRTLA